MVAEGKALTHGHRAGGKATPEYDAWCAMRKRCSNPRHPLYKFYGGRGIKVCKRWDSFENFLEDMGPRPHAGLSLDRIDNENDYGPDNCRWATVLEQQRNRRSNKMLTYSNETVTLTYSMKEWSERLGIKYTTLKWRVRNGWPVEKALGLVE